MIQCAESNVHVLPGGSDRSRDIKCVCQIAMKLLLTNRH